MIRHLSLTHFRNHADSAFDPGAAFTLLSGPNGAGKTNILEAISLLSPGRGLRRAPLRAMAAQDGPGGFALHAKLADGSDVGVGTAPASPDRRIVRINGANASASALAERLAIVWLTPAMDRLFVEGAAGRRQFLDRLTFALEPDHARNANRYERAMRERNRLLAEEARPDGDWLDGLESAMAEAGHALHDARQRTVEALNGEEVGAADFPASRLDLAGFHADDLAEALATGRSRDAAAGRTLAGPHRSDLSVIYEAKQMQAADCSTGEQKALLVGIVLAHAALVAERRGMAPILLLDEVAAHLDPDRRAALYAALKGRGQVFMTATEAALFEGIDEAARFTVRDGRLHPA